MRSEDDPGLAAFADMLEGVFGDKCIEENPVRIGTANKRDEQAATQRELFAAREAEGVCIVCGKQPPKAQSKKCADCIWKIGAAKRELKRKREAAGLCKKCGKKPVKPGRKNCPECLAKQTMGHREYLKRREARRPAPPAAEPLTTAEKWALERENKLRGYGRKEESPGPESGQ